MECNTVESEKSCYTNRWACGCGEQMLSYGCTRLEIGLQSTYEDVARDTNRGHTVAAVGDCFHLAKDAGFKVCPAVAIITCNIPDLAPEFGCDGALIALYQ